MTKITEILDSLSSTTPSKWQERAKWRKENKSWLRKSQRIAVLVKSVMKAQNLTQKDIAYQMGVTPQYISKILKGSENLSLETISKLEKVLGTDLIQINESDKTDNNIAYNLNITYCESIKNKNYYTYNNKFKPYAS